MTKRVRYGEHPSQYVEVWAPGREPALKVAVLHGGWWRAKHDLRYMDPLCSSLASRGATVFNVEFRRTEGDGGGWPQTLDDVLEALDAVVAPWPSAHRSPPIVLGHSAGGHLALLAALRRPMAGVVAQAPITDLARCAHEELGEAAVPLFMGATPAEAASEYEAASPRCRVSVSCPQLVVQGDLDVRVPVEHTRDYVRAARDAGAPVDYLEIGAGDHFVVVDPRHWAWMATLDWLDARHC